MRQPRIAVALVVGTCLSCVGTPSEWAGWERQPVGNGYWLAKGPVGSFCVAEDDDLGHFCETTVGASEIGWDDRYVAVRIDVPSKEYLLVDTAENLVWVLDATTFCTTPEARGVKMVEVEQAWERLGRPLA